MGYWDGLSCLAGEYVLRRLEKDREIKEPGMGRRVCWVLFGMIGLLIGGASGGFGADRFFALGSEAEKDAWEVEALELTYDQEKDLYTAVGEVVLKKGDRILKADRAWINRRTLMAEAKGNVALTAGGDELKGEELTVDLKRQIGEVKNGRLFLKQNNVHVTGREIHKTGESSYRVVDGTLTTCDGEKVPWQIRAKELTVTFEGYGHIWHSTFRVQGQPVLYVPYMVFPAKTKRQSGLLLPDPGYSERDGLTLTLPIYWVLSDPADITFYEHVMSRRGFMQGVEFRYLLSPGSKGTLMADYLFQDQKD